MSTIVINEFDTQIAQAAAELRALRAKRLATLPRVTAEELAIVVEAERMVTVPVKVADVAKRVKSERQFTDEDKDQISAAREAHKEEVNTKETKAAACRAVRKAHLSAFKMTLRKDGRVGLRIAGIV